MPYYGDQQSAYTNMRAAFGPYGGAIATGVYGPGPSGYAPPVGYQPEGAPQGMGAVAQVGAAIRPVGYMPAPRMYTTPAGQYVMESGIGKSLGRLTGYADAPRSMYAYDYRMQASADFMERASTGLVGGGLMAAALAATPVLAPMGGAVGSVLGAGVGGLAGAPFGSAASLGLGRALTGVGRFAGALAAPLAVAGVASDLTEHMAQQRQIRNYLEMSSFRFVGPNSSMTDPIMGTGMSMQARRQVADYMTEIDVADPFVDLKDLGRILRTSTELGLMHNTQDVDDFKRRFKEITESVKLVTKALNTTLEEGLSVMRDLRGIGVEDPARARQLIMGSEPLGRVAGRTTQEMVTAGLQGAEIFRGTGISMDIGFQATQMNLAAVRAARDAGTLSQEAVAQAGGEESLAQRMTVRGLAFQQSAIGRGVMGAMWAGRGNELDLASINRMVQGDMSVPGLALQAARRMGSPRRLIEYQANQARLLSRFGEMFGGQANQIMQLSTAMTEAKYLQQQMPGLEREDAFRFVLQQQGMTEPEIESNIGLIRNAEENFRSNIAAADSSRIRGLTEQSVSNMLLTRWYEKFVKDPYTGFKQAVTAPLNRGIDNLTVSFQKFGRRLAGIETADLSDVEYKKGMMGSALDMVLAEDSNSEIAQQVEEQYAQEAEARNLNVGPSRARVRAMMERIEARRKGPINLDNYRSLSDKPSEELADMLEKMGGDLGITLQTGNVRRPGEGPEIVLDEAAMGTGTRGISRADRERLAALTETFNVTQVQAEKMRKGEVPGFEEAAARLRERADFPAFRERAERAISRGNAVELLKALTGKEDVAEMSRVEVAAAREMFPEMAENFDELRKLSLAARNVEEQMDTRSVKQLQQISEDARVRAAERIAPFKGRKTMAGVGGQKETYEYKMYKERLRETTGRFEGIFEEYGRITLEGREPTAEEKDALIRRYVANAAAEGVTLTRLQAEDQLDRIFSSKETRQEAQEAFFATQELQRRRAQTEEGERIVAAAESIKEKDRVGFELVKGVSRDIAADPLALMRLGKEEVTALGKAGLTDLIIRRKRFLDIEKIAGEDRTISDEEVPQLRKYLKEHYEMSDEEMLKYEITAKKEGGLDLVLRGLQAGLQTDVVTERMGAGGGEGGLMSEASSAQQRYALTVNIHKAIYDSMVALRDQLGK